MIGESEDELFVINYQGLLSMLSMLMESEKEGKNRERKLSPGRIKLLLKLIQVVVFDEIHYCRNVKSLTYRMCNQISKALAIRYGLTGTLLGRDPVGLWAPFFLIDRGVTLGNTLGLYRESALVEVKAGWKSKYKLRKSESKTIQGWLKNRSVIYEDKECNELPERVSVPVPFRLTAEQSMYYQNIAQGMIEAHGNLREVKSSFIRLRQVASGYLTLPGDEETEKVEISFPDNPRMDAVEALLDEFPDDDKVVISCEYVPSLELVHKVLTRRKKEAKAKWTIGTLYGKTKDKSVWTRFQEDPAMRYFVMTSASGGTGIDLFAGNRGIFYESPVRPDIRKQTEKRVHRTGQTKRTYIYDLMALQCGAFPSVDDKIQGFLKEGKDLEKELFHQVKRLFGVDT